MGLFVSFYFKKLYFFQPVKSLGLSKTREKTHFMGHPFLGPHSPNSGALLSHFIFFFLNKLSHFTHKEGRKEGRTHSFHEEYSLRLCRKNGSHSVPVAQAFPRTMALPSSVVQS
jgi:hypothetical protein